jgi:hypothetical protein
MGLILVVLRVFDVSPCHMLQSPYKTLILNFFFPFGHGKRPSSYQSLGLSIPKIRYLLTVEFSKLKVHCLALSKRPLKVSAVVYSEDKPDVQDNQFDLQLLISLT